MTVAIINKTAFIDARYENFKRKVKAFEDMGFNLTKEKMHFHIYMGNDAVGMLIDLDEKCEDIKEIELYKEMVICDGCNGHIDEDTFIQIDDNMTYHHKCYGGDKSNLYKKTTEEIVNTLNEQCDNVVSIFKGKAK